MAKKRSQPPPTRSPQPPMQGMPGIFNLEVNSKRPMPTYQFGVANIDKHGRVEISFAIPVVDQSNLPADPRQTEEVSQPYCVLVPYTETLDGISTSKMRVENRELKVRVKKRKRKSKGKPKLVSRSYYLWVPYTEQTDKGTVVRVGRQTRSRLVPEDAPQIDYTTQTITQSYPVSKLLIYGKDRKRLSNESATKRLKEILPNYFAQRPIVRNGLLFGAT